LTAPTEMAAFLCAGRFDGYLKSMPARNDLDIKRRGCKENLAATWNIETL